MAEKKNETLDFVNMIRSRTTLNGKPLSPLTQEDLDRQAERAAKDRERREKILAQKREELHKMIDREVHTIADTSPTCEFSKSDYLCDYEYGFDMSFTENRSYYVTVHAGGDPNKSMIARHFQSWTDSRETVKWLLPGGRYVDVDDSDTWEYTEEAFEQGLSELNV